MKKYLLSLATLLFGATMMQAADVTFDFVNETYGLTRAAENNDPYIDNGTALTENGGVTVTLNKTEGKNGWRLWKDGLRVYKNSGSSMTLSAAEPITSIEFTMAKASVITGYSVNGGAAATVTDKVFTVAGGANTINLDLNVTNNGAIASMKVVLNGETPTPPTPPTPVETVGDGTASKPYTVADLIKLNNPGTTGQWVTGVIVGVMNYDQEAKKNVFSATELTTNSNIVIAATAADYGTNYTAVQIKGDIRDALNLVDNPANLGKTVTICGNLEEYCGTCGVKNTTAYTLDGETPTPPTPVETVGDGTASKPYTVADLIKLNNPGTTGQWVTGTIVGVMNFVEDTGNVFSATELTTSFNVVIAATSADFGTAYVAVQLPAGDIRTALNLVDNPGNLGKTVTVCGDLEKYCGVAGVKNTTAYTLDGETPTPPTPVGTEGDGTEANPFTVADLIKLGNPGTKAQWVTGTIVGVMNFTEGTGNWFSATELNTNANIVIAATAADFGTDYVAVQLPAGQIRDDLNLVDRPGNLGKEVSVCGDLEKYCGVAGVKNTTAYNIIGGLAPLPVAETASLTSFVEDQCTSNTKIVAPVTVFYQSADKKYTFITDGETNLEVYAGAGLPYAYENGDQLSGIVGKFGYFQNMPQLTPQADTFGEPVKGTAVEPVEKAIDAIRPADYVLLHGVKITSVTEEKNGKTVTTYTATDGVSEVTVYNRFNIEGLADGENLTILCIGAVYGETNQIFPIEITEGTSDSITEINAAEGAAAIFDLQGRRLSAPVKGINIINGRKVLVK